MNDYSEKNDQTLVELTLLGEESAYEELVTRHQRAVMGTAYKVTNNTYSAEDALQDAFVSAFMNLSSLRDGSRFGSWVCSIAKNCARTLDRHYRSTVPDLSLDLLQVQGEGSEWEPIEADYSDLHAAVDALSEKLRETVMLHYFEEKSVSEIAQQLSVPIGTVKWRLSEGRKQLRKGFGMTEQTYNENESIVTRVMRQVEALKLWRLKNVRVGFEEEYSAVLSAVEGLEDSKEKSHMLADTLLLGAWWIKGKDNDEVYARIKKAAEESHNDDVMKAIMSREYNKFEDGDKRIEFRENTQIPYLRENNYPKSLAYVLFWLGYEYKNKDDLEKAIECFREILKIVPPSDVYYANALSAIDGETRAIAAKKDPAVVDFNVGAAGEIYKEIDGKIFFWNQPGYGSNSYMAADSLFWNLSPCDSLLLDKSMQVGETKISSNKTVTFTYLESGSVTETPAGRFENCSVYVAEGLHYGLTYVKTWLCEGVGIVRQIVTHDGETYEWGLKRYEVRGGQGFLPFAKGNKWEYALLTAETAMINERENIFEVIAHENGSTTVSAMAFVATKGYYDTWEGKTVEARRGYSKPISLVDILPALARAEELAVTKREKVHSKVAGNVMRRIFETDPDFNPNHTEVGRWNFFEYDKLEKKDGKIIFHDDRKYSFEWKNMKKCGSEGTKVLYTFLYTILGDATGCIWSDEWVDGYFFAEKQDTDEYKTRNFRVTGGETVVTPAGTFENCRHISFDYDSWGYFKGKSEFFFAPGVGIVRFEHPFGKEGKVAVWELSEYRGKGEGYFPLKDGLFRRYEPDSLENGWHGSIEYTFDEDETGFIMLKNALGTQDRDAYEKAIKPKEKK